MSHDDHGHLVFGQFLDNLEHFAGKFRVQGTRRLVKEKYLRVHRERAGNGHALLLAAAEFAGVSLLLAFEAHPLEQESSHSAGILAFVPQHTHRSETKVLKHSQVREQVEVLEHEPRRKSNIAERFRRCILDCRSLHRITRHHHDLAVNLHQAAVNRFELSKATQQRTLAGTAGPDNRKHLARLQVKRNILEHMQVAKGLLDVLYLEDRRRFIHVFHSTPHL